MAITGFIDTQNGPYILKDPMARRTYGIEWELLPGDTIASAVWTVDSGLNSELPAIDGNVTEIVLYDGTAETDYKVRCVMTTAQGEVDARTFTVKVKIR